jgi:membrane-associated protein
MGGMHYARFMMFNVVGGVLWVILFLYTGFFFGNMPSVQENFTLLIFGIIGLSLLPIVWEWWRARKPGHQ